MNLSKQHSGGTPTLHFESAFDERLAYEARMRGHLGGVTVELEDGSLHSVFFYDAVRLAQDLEAMCDIGLPYVAERGMIVLTEITFENMMFAVTSLLQRGFFAPSSCALASNRKGTKSGDE